MDILRYYYKRILRLNEAIPMLKDILKDDRIFKKLCATTLLCCVEDAADFKIASLDLSTNKPHPGNLTTFESFLNDIDRSLTSNDDKFIFRTSKLNCAAWKHLREICGDCVFRGLFTSFDIFEMDTTEMWLTQLVGYPLNLRHFSTNSVSVKPNIATNRQKCRIDINKSTTRKTKAGFNLFSARQFMYSRDLRESVKRGLFKFWTISSYDNQLLVLELVKDVFGINSTVIFNSVTPLFADLIKRYKRNCFRGLLDYYCPLPNNYANVHLKALAEQYLSSSQVRSYFRGLLFKLIPVELLGCKNLAFFVSQVSDKIVEFRRFDQCNLREFVDSFKVGKLVYLIVQLFCTFFILYEEGPNCQVHSSGITI